MRRVRPTPGSQLALFTNYDNHAFVTDRTAPMLETEADHRRHAIVEQSIAELKRLAGNSCRRIAHEGMHRRSWEEIAQCVPDVPTMLGGRIVGQD